MKPSFLHLWEPPRRVPTISASVSWLILFVID
jgi:hypothetical protein